MVKSVNIAEQYPENLLFWSSEKLMDYERRLTQNARGNMLAELLVRWYFNPQSKAVADYLSQKLPEESIIQFKTWCANASPLQKPNLLFIDSQKEKESSTRDFLQKVQFKAQRRFENLLGNCDGIVPVIREEADDNKFGCAIPFRLEPADNSGSCVIDLDDNPLPEWSEAVSELNLPEIRVRLLFHSSVEKDLQYTGFSLQFPVLMAYWRQNEQLPKYNPFAVVATGKIQDNRLVPVRFEEKFDGLKERFDKLVFFYPDSDNAGSREMVPIPVGTSVDDVLSICNNQLVSRKHEIGLFSFGIKYIIKRLETIANSVKKDSESSWDYIIKNLQMFLDELDPDQYPEHYLNALMTLSFAYCHSANTAKAHEYNRKAIKFAMSVKDRCDDIRYQLLLLSIEEMVLLQDEENFEQIPGLASEIEAQLDKLDENSPETYDLKMRFYGTLGQAHMFGSVCKMEGFDKDIALDCIQKAVQFARLYQDNTVEDNIDDVIRDMNYRHLWYSLFEPGSEDERKYYNMAVQETKDNQSPGASKDNNRNFQFRQKCLAAYRRILLSRANPDVSCSDEPIPAPANIQFWVEALIYKYQAAALAAQNRKADAKDKFDKSIAIMTTIASPLIQYIAMTIAAEAYRSFSVLGDASTADYYRQAALGLFSGCKDFRDFKTAPSWKQFLNTPWDEFQATGEDFPGLNYYY